MIAVRVLLIDDSADFMASAAAYLARDPRVRIVGQAFDGHAGLQMVEALSPDIVFLDLRLPALSGLDVARRIKAGVGRARVYIISVHHDQGIRLSAEHAGADGFIPKAHFAELSLEAIAACHAAANLTG